MKTRRIGLDHLFTLGTLELILNMKFFLRHYYLRRMSLEKSDSEWRAVLTKEQFRFN
jgi:hypothetical protein